VTLEALTQAERNLLYQIRVYARFRKELYVEIASNNGGSISGSSFQPSGVLSSGSGGTGGLGGSGLTPGVIAGFSSGINGPLVSSGSAGSRCAWAPWPSGWGGHVTRKGASPGRVRSVRAVGPTTLPSASVRLGVGTSV